MSPAKSRPPANSRALEAWIHAWVEETGDAHGVIRRRIGMLALAGMVEHLADREGPALVFKGGSSLELRYASRARASRDVDLVATRSLSDLADVLDKALRAGWRGFTGRMREPEDLAIPWADIAGHRIDVKLSFGGRPFSTLVLEVTTTNTTPEIEYVPALSLANIGIDQPNAIPCLSLAQQVAEKIHACTDPLDGVRLNDRVNDVMDLIIIEDLAGSDLDLAVTRVRCATTFTERATHPWPPRIAVQPGWPDRWTRMVEDNSFYISDVDVAVERANELIRRIDTADDGLPTRRT